MIFDTHCHYNDESYGADREALLRSLPEQGVDRICEIGYNLESSKEAIRLAREFYSGTSKICSGRLSSGKCG